MSEGLTLTYTEPTFVREQMSLRTCGRKLLWAYALLMLIAAFGYARFDSYMMDGDGTAFLDIAQDLNTHHAALAINGYWNPGYPALLAVAERLAHPTLWRELAVVRYTNVLVFAFAMAACVFFTSGLVQARFKAEEEAEAAVSAGTLHLLGLALLVLSMGRELPVAAPRADTLLLAFLLLAGGLLMRILVADRLLLYVFLGLVLGCGYLTKSFAFLPSAVLFLALLVRAVRKPAGLRGRTIAGAALAVAVFACTAGPYILAISRQLGHFTTGESARLNYAFFIDLTPRWHEWFHHDLGHAGGPFLHPETALATAPPVFSYAAHPTGTYPLWFDPAWWTAGLKPHVWLPGHLLRLARNIVVFARYLLGRPEIFVLLAVLLAFGAMLPTVPRLPKLSHGRGQRTWTWAAPPLLWGALMFLIYLPIDLQDRYLTGPLLLVVLPLFGALRAGEAEGSTRESLPLSRAYGVVPLIANALVLLFAGIALSQAATYLADRRRHTPHAEQRHPGFDAQIFTAAAALDQLGLKPGEGLACMGDLACYTDFYWARLAGGQILGEVETPGEANPLQVWNNTPDRRRITDPLRALGLRYLVSLFPNSGSKPEGWVQLGQSNFFAYPLQELPSPAQRQAIESFHPAP